MEGECKFSAAGGQWCCGAQRGVRETAGRQRAGKVPSLASVWQMLKMVEDLPSLCAARHTRVRLAASQHHIAGLRDGQRADALGGPRAAWPHRSVAVAPLAPRRPPPASARVHVQLAPPVLQPGVQHQGEGEDAANSALGRPRTMPRRSTASRQTRDLCCIETRLTPPFPTQSAPAMDSRFRPINMLASTQPTRCPRKHPDPQDNAPPTPAVPAPENSP